MSTNSTLQPLTQKGGLDLKLDKINKLLNASENHLAVVQQGLDLTSKCLDVYQESRRIDLSIAQIQAKTDIQLAQISAKYTLCQQTLLHIFGEREQALNKHYAVLDNAMQTGDREMVIVALQGISSIVVSNPLEQFTEMVKALEDPKAVLELDF